MSERVEVLAAAALLEGRPTQVKAFGREIAVVRWQGQIYALDDVCPHRGAPLSQGEVVHNCLECPLHGWAFALETGRMPGSKLAVEVFEVTEEAGAIFLSRAEAPAP